MPQRHDPDGLRLPIKLDTTSNGEFCPIPLDHWSQLANTQALDAANRNAKRLGLPRRDFLISACGAASTLLAFNAAQAAAGRVGGFYALPDDAALDPQLAAASLQGDEFIFDVQGHFVDPKGAWLKALPADALPLSGLSGSSCAGPPGIDRAYISECMGPEAFIRDVFLDSDTELMVLSFVPSTREGEPLTIEEAAATRDIVNAMEGTHRLFLHGRVNPNQAGDVEDMARLKAFGVKAWKTYTQWGPDGVGFAMTDAKVGIPFLEEARRLDVRIVAIHKGLPFGEKSYEHSLCDDIGPIAKLYPDISFLIYHAGYVAGQTEGPYDPDRNEGIDSLIKTVVDNDLGHGSNVYAELGSTWRFLMRDPDSAAHTMGKLLKYLGEDNILWGTDSIWYGSPQDQIQAFRTFEISAELQEKYGYPALTAARKRKIFGLNALPVYGVDRATIAQRLHGDRIATVRENYRNAPDPHFLTRGPRTRREFMNLQSWMRGAP